MSEPQFRVTRQWSAVQLTTREDIEAAVFADLRAKVEALPRHSCEPCDPDPDGWAIDRAGVLALLKDPS